MSDSAIKDGAIKERDGRITFRYERQLHHPVEVVWRAITDPDEIARWTGSRPEIDLRPGGRFVSFHRGGERVVDRIVRLEPLRLFEHTFWAHLNPTAVVRWEIAPVEQGCLLWLMHALSSDDVHTAAEGVALGDDVTTILARNGAGWHRLLDMLEATLDGQSIPWSEQDQQALQDRYAARLR